MGFSQSSLRDFEGLIQSWWSTWFSQKNQNLNPGNYNQFEVDDAKSKLQFMTSWKWRSGAGKLVVVVVVVVTLFIVG